MVTLGGLLSSMLMLVSAMARVPLPKCAPGAVLHLEAMEYKLPETESTLYECGTCTLIGKPGTSIVDGMMSACRELQGHIRLENATLAFSPYRTIISSGAMVVFKDVTIDTDMLSVGQATLKVTGGSWSRALLLTIDQSHVTLTDFDLSNNVGTITIDQSIVNMIGTTFGTGYHCPQIQNSDVSLVSSTIRCWTPEEDMLIQNSSIKLKKSEISVNHASGVGRAGSAVGWQGNLSIVDTTVEATCAGRPVISISGDGVEKTAAKVKRSNMYFMNCSCASDKGWTLPIISDTFHMQESTVDYGECIKTKPTKTIAEPDTMLV